MTRRAPTWPATPGCWRCTTPGMTLADVDEAFVGYIQPASMLGIKAMKELGLTGLPVTHIENASATGLVAFREAAWAVSSGRADVAMALVLRQVHRHDERRRPWRRAGPDRRADPARRLLRAVGAAAHARAGHHARALRHHRGEELELRRHVPDSPTGAPTTSSRAEEVLAARMVAEPLTTMMCCPPDDGAACVILAREDLVRERQPGRPLVRALASALTSETYSPGPHLRRSGRRSVDHDAGHGRAVLRGGRRSGPRTSAWPTATTPSSTRSSSTTSCSGSAPRARARSSWPRARPGPGGRIPFNTDGGLARPRPPRRADRAGHGARGGAAAAGRGGGPPGRGCPGGARAPRRRRQHRHRQPAWVVERSDIMTTSDERRAAGREIQGQLWPATLNRARPGSSRRPSWPRTSSTTCSRARSATSGRARACPVRDRSHDHRRRARRARPARGAAGPPGRGAATSASTATSSSRSSCTSRSTPACPPPAPHCGWRPTCSARTEQPADGLRLRRSGYGRSPGSGPQRSATSACCSANGDELAPVGAAQPLRRPPVRGRSCTADATGVGTPSVAPGLDDEPGVLGGQRQGELRGAAPPVDRLDLAVEVEVRRPGGAQDLDGRRGPRSPPWPPSTGPRG